MKKPIRIYTPYMDLLHETDNYISLQFIPRFYEIGEFELHINQYVEGAEFFQKNHLIMLDKRPDKVMIIKHREIEIDENGKQTENWKIKGTTLDGVLNRRLTVPPEGEAYDKITADAETVIKHYIERNFINPDDPKRKIKFIELAPNQHRGPVITWESRYKKVGDEISAICKQANLGFLLYADMVRKKWIFDVVEPRDLTQDNPDGNPPVFFSPDFFTIKSQYFVDSDANYSNFGYIGGQGEGEERKIVTVGEAEGLERIEIFIDARDIGSDDEEELPEEQIEQLLIERGQKKMEEYSTDFYLEAQILTPATYLPNSRYSVKPPFEYEKDFRLGDVVQVFNKEWGITMDAPITEFREIHESNGFTLEATFGQAQPTVIEKIKKEFDKINGVEQQEIPAKLTVQQLEKSYQYTNQKVSEEEQKRIQQALENLEEARRIAEEEGQKAEQNSKSYTDTKVADIQGQIEDLVNNLDEYIGDSFFDGVIQQSEAKVIESYIVGLENKKAEFDSKYDSLVNNPYLPDPEKTDLMNKKATFDDTHANLIEAIQNAIFDGKATEAEITEINSRMAIYRAAIQDLSATFEYVADIITGEKSEEVREDAANRANQAEQNAKDYTDSIKLQIDDQIQNVQEGITNLNEYVDGAFRDGIINEGEANAIEKYLNVINAEKANIDGRYNAIYNDPNLGGQAKKNLESAKNAYNTAHTNLIDSINAAIADGKVDDTEKADVDTKFSAYQSALILLSQRFEEAIRAIEQAKADKAKNEANAYADQKKQEAIQFIEQTTQELQTIIGDIQSDLALKADAEWVNGQLVTKADKANTYTKQEVDNALNSKVSVTQYTTDINGIITDLTSIESRVSQTETELLSKLSITEYQQDQENLSAQLSNITATLQQHANQILLKVDAVNVYTKTEIDGKLTVVNQQISDLSAELSVQAGQIATKVSQTEFTKQLATKANASDVYTKSDIQILAANNLLHNSEWKENTASWSLTSGWTRDTSKTFQGSNTMKVDVSGLNSDEWRAIFSEFINVSAGQQLVASGYVLSDDITTIDRGASLEIEWYNSTSRISVTGTSIKPTANNTWQRFSVSGTAPSGTVKARIRFHPVRNGRFWVARPMLQFGVIPTAFTPHVDELAVNISSRLTNTETSITQLANQITLKADQSVVNTLTGQVSNIQSQITVMAGQISSKVEKDGVISAINQTAEQIKIQASKVDLSGYVTFTNLSTPGQTIIDGGNLKTGSVTADKIAAKAITADKLNVTSLSAISANLGTVTAGTLRGVKLEGALVDATTGLTVYHLSISANGYPNLAIYGDPNVGAFTIRTADGIDSAHAASLNIVADGILRLGGSTYGTIETETVLVQSPMDMDGNDIDNVNYLYAKHGWFDGQVIELSNTSLANIYIRPQSGGSVRFTAAGTSDSFVPIYASNVYANSIDVNGLTSGVHLYARPTSGGKLRVTVTGTTDTFRPVEASAFENRSLAEHKQDIVPWEGSGLDIIRNSTIYQFRKKEDVDVGVDKVKYGLVIGDGYRTPEEVLNPERTAVDVSIQVNIAWKAIQEHDDTIMGLQDEVEWLKLENQMLKQEISQLKSKIAELEAKVA